MTSKADGTNGLTAEPTFDQVCDWCESFDNYAAEGWLCLVLDGTYSVAEMRAAISAGRSPVPQLDTDTANKRLVDEVYGLPDYRGWYVTLNERHDADVCSLEEKLVWKHNDNDTKIWIDFVHKSSTQIDVVIEVADPNDGPYARGAYETLPEHTAAAVFAVCKPLLDEYSSDEPEVEQKGG